MIKSAITLIFCILALNLTAQEVVVEYPYNPDFENDGNVGVEDLMQLLASFGMGFDVDEITIDEVALSEWLQAISETLVAQQALIDSLMSNEANSGMGQLDSALIADMINEAGSATASFGERVVLKEFQETTSQELEDWFSEIPLSPVWYYGEFDFDTDGILHLGLSNNAMFDIAILPDSINVEEITVNEIWNSLVEELYDERSWSIALQENEKLVFVSSDPDEHADIFYASWLPLESAASDETGNEPSGQIVQVESYSPEDTISVDPMTDRLIITATSIPYFYTVSHVAWIGSTPTGISVEVETPEDVISHLAEGDFIGSVSPEYGEMIIDVSPCQSAQLTIQFEFAFDSSNWESLAAEIHNQNFPLWYGSWQWNSNYPELMLVDGVSPLNQVGNLSSPHRLYENTGSELSYPTETGNPPTNGSFTMINLGGTWVPL